MVSMCHKGRAVVLHRPYRTLGKAPNNMLCLRGNWANGSLGLIQHIGFMFV